MSETNTVDIAGTPGKLNTFKDSPIFDLDSEEEFNSFAKGRKSFHRWKAHTKSEEIRQWAKTNHKTDFYIRHKKNNGENIIKISRGKKNEN